MIVWKLRSTLLLLLTLPFLATAQNARSYDTNDWIPITPATSRGEEVKKASGRVLNLDSPNQKFFPDEYLQKQQSQQYLRETIKKPKQQLDQPYVFESVPPLRPQEQYQYVPQLQPILSPPPPPKNNHNNQNYYDTKQEYTIPFNKSFYQSLNPGAINQEILGAIQNQPEIPELQTTTSKTQEKESVQLLYVPLENLKLNQQQPQQTQQFSEIRPPILRQEKQIVSRIQNQNKQHQLDNIQDDFISQAYAAHKLQQQLQLGQPILLQTTTPQVFTTTTTQTPKPKKRKPNQPPLAVYMEKPGPAAVKDVLEVLKNAKSIAVQDNVGPDSPQVFVGPSNLNSPEGYTKFPLPYLSSLEGNRIERKVDQLPFFVAPLSYKTPDGYSKIPLPSPHVGSVVISTKDDLLHEKRPFPRQSPLTQNQIKEDFDVKNPFVQQNPAYQFIPQYEQVPPNKDFLPHYQVNTEKANVQQFQPTTSGNFDFDYQTTPRINQNYQQTFIHNFQADNNNNKPQFSIDNFSTTKTPADVFRFTSTTESSTLRQFEVPKNVESLFTNEPQIYQPQNLRPAPPVYQVNQPQTTEYQPVTTPHTDILRQAINQYELQQINNQFVERNAPPATSTEIHYEVPTTSRSQVRTRGRQRSRPTTVTTSTSTPSNDNEKYTVLEEFSIKPKATTVKYTTEIETIPANVYKLNQDQLEPVYVQQKQQQEPIKQHVLNQETLDQQILQHQTQPKDEAHSNAPLVFHRGQHINTEPIYQTQQEPQYHQQQEPQHQQQQELQYHQQQEPQYHQQQEQVPEINPFLPGLINNLQDQAVKTLLVPGLLVPSTQKPSTTTIVSEIITSTTEAPRLETTTTKRSRGRQRGSSARYTVPTSSAPRRNVSRRRPSYTRTTTERPISKTTESSSSTDYEPTRRQLSSRQRFRTRTRPTQVTERVIQASPEETSVSSFKQPVLEGGFQASQQDPQSYMQLEHTIEEQKIVALKPEVTLPNAERINKEYHQVYNLQSELSTAAPQPIVDVHVTHTTTEPEIVTAPHQDTRFIKVNANIQSGGAIHNHRTEEYATKSSARPRGKPRIRLKSPSSTPKTISSTATAIKENSEEAQGEYYGFIRSPSFNKPAPLVYTTTEQNVYSSTYRTSPKTIIQLPDEEITDRHDHDSSTPVHFVGEIRPKYHQTTTEEAPKAKTRSRVRVPLKKTYEERPSGGEEETTRRSSPVRSRSRGKSHFKLPDNLHQKRDDDDVEGGNYPAGYLNKDNNVTEKPASFQITVDPYEEVEEGDQEPHSSLYRPKFVPNPEWVDASILPPLNDLPSEDKKVVVSPPSALEETTTLPESEELVATTTEAIEVETTTTKKKSRRRGVWKLVKQRPLDHLETAESQNYQSVLNSFDEIRKEASNTTTETSILDTIYNMFNFAKKESENNTTSKPEVDEIQTTTALPTFPEELTTEQLTTTSEDVETTEAPIVTTIKNVDVEPWEMRQIKTSTSTEVSHETEICYKGRCVKSKDKTKK